MDAMVTLLSDTFLTKDGIKYTGDVLAGKKTHHVVLVGELEFKVKDGDK